MAIAAARSSSSATSMSLSHRLEDNIDTSPSNYKNIDEDDDDDDDDDDGHEHDMVMPGFRFHPTEEELVEFYLRRKVEGKPFNVELITFLDLYRYDPWQLPGLATIGEKEWYFYVPRDRKYRNGDRPNRVTTSGYWKATGADRMIRTESSRSIGLKKTLVFYSGKAPKGIRTTWIMNEYRLPHHETQRFQKAEISLCRVYKRGGSGVEEHTSLPRCLPTSQSHHHSNKNYEADDQLGTATTTTNNNGNNNYRTLGLGQSSVELMEEEGLMLLMQQHQPQSLVPASSFFPTTTASNYNYSSSSLPISNNNNNNDHHHHHLNRPLPPLTYNQQHLLYYYCNNNNAPLPPPQYHHLHHPNLHFSNLLLHSHQQPMLPPTSFSDGSFSDWNLIPDATNPHSMSFK